MCVIQFEINAMMKKVIEMLLLLLSAYCVVYYVPVEAQRTSTVTRTTTSTATSTVTILSKVSLIKEKREILKFNYWPFLFFTKKFRWFALNWWTLRAFVDVDAVYRLTSPSFWHLTTNWKNLSMKHFIIFFIPVNFYRPEPSGNSILKLDSIWQIHSRLIRAHPSSKFHSYFTNKREFWLLN